jgi:small subunit ribosomal protein S9
MNSKTRINFSKNNIGLGKESKQLQEFFLFQVKEILLLIKPGDKYLQYNDTYLKLVWSPLEKLNLEKQFDIVALVNGGGLTGQAEAIQLGVARRLCEMDKENRPILKPFGFLTRDSRIKERKKYGLRKARKAPQYSKR